MYVRTRRLDALPDTQGEAGRIWQESIIPTLQKQKGFRHIYAAGNQQNGKILMVFVWDSKADSEAWLAQPEVQKSFAPLAALATSPPVTDEYEVLAEG